MDSAAETRTPTVTEREQWIVENDVFQIYNIFANVDQDVKSFMLELRRERHLEYLDRGLRHLGPSFCVLDANRPWLCYWILQSIALLGESVDQVLESNTIDFLSRCQDPDGGYGGGPGQMPHLATTYAAVNSLITVGGHGALSSINRDTLYTFLLRMKQPNGGFSMHDGGEVDVRACYTAISVASILNILDDELVQNVGSYILSCQTYEGGIGGEPGSEAHGGYTFCGLATMILINEVNRLNLTCLIDWLVFRQGREGGFQGRTNKLVDGCYSFWQGGDFVLLRRLGSLIEDQLLIQNIGEDHSPHASTASGRVEGTSVGGGPNTSSSVNYNNIGYNFIYKHPEMELLFNNILLQQYILLCSQSLQADEGGLRDKPRKSRDHYHTCYCLSGLSVSQHCRSNSEESLPLPVDVLGPYTNLLEPVHPLFNVILKQYFEAHEFFSTSTP